MNSTQKTTIIAALIAVLVLFSYAHAKPPPADLGYEPPDGWEYIMKLDSTGTFNLHCHNDTCFLASRLYTNPSVLIYVLSTDGGETWEKIPSLPAPRIFKHNSNALHRMIFDFDENKRYYEVSYDFFKTSERYQDAKLSLGAKDLLESPIDTNLLISVHEGKQSTHTGEIHTMSIQISRNAGRNWEILKLFRYSHGFTTYQFNFDWAEKEHWFYKSGDGYNDLDYERQADKYFETFDNGKTFREIKFDPIAYEYIGLDGKNTMRTFGKRPYRYLDSASHIWSYYFTIEGIQISKYSDEILSTKNINWLQLIDQSKPNTNIDSGYIFTLNQYYTKSFQFDNSNYKNQYIDAEERIDVNLGKREAWTNEIFLSETKDLGNMWIRLNYFKKKPKIRSTFLDQGNKTLWLLTIDEQFSFSTPLHIFKGSLWKLKLPWEPTSVEDFKGDDENIAIYPNPASEYITIQTSEVLETSEVSGISIFNTLGECVIELAD
ncbi:MAG: hypothetical protein M9949_15090, partial [Candidatus Kapabacteria bacterium]|nr:hypothetical protein [Candidatus Kapabacteria bacterium]